MADPLTIALSIGGGIVAAGATLVATAWTLRGELATKKDIDKVREDFAKHEEKDDEREQRSDDKWEANGNRSEQLAWTLGRIAGHLGVPTEDQPSRLFRPDPRASRPK
jgi:hypothetical protein